jgi:hypothetical protein
MASKKRDTVQISIRLPKDEHAKLATFAESREVPINDVLRVCIRSIVRHGVELA